MRRPGCGGAGELLKLGMLGWGGGQRGLQRYVWGGGDVGEGALKNRSSS